MRTSRFVVAAAVTASLAVGGVAGAVLGNPLTSGAEGTGATTTTVAGTPATPKGPTDGPGMGRGPRHLDTAAEVLGLEVDELAQRLRDGETLAEVAEAEGVDRQELIDALVAEAEADLEARKAELPDRIAAMVDGEFPGRGDGTGGPGGMGHGPGMGRGPGLDAAAEVLGLSVEDLGAKLRDGSTLAQIAAEQDVDPQEVIDALVADAEAHLDEAVTAGRLTQEQADEKAADLTERITTLVNEGMGAMGPMGPHGHGPGGPAGAPGDAPEGDGGN